MTKFECEMALMKLGEAAQEIVRMYNPECNHTSISINLDGYINVSGAKFDGAKLVKDNLLDASKYPDEHMRFGGEVEESA